MRTFEEIKNTIETGLGKHPCDLRLTNVKLVNVFSGEIYPTDIYIKNKRIVSIEPGAVLEALETVDCGSFEPAVRAAAAASKEGDVVLMSPASAAFDQFKNFMVRGEFYKKLVKEL